MRQLITFIIALVIGLSAPNLYSTTSKEVSKQTNSSPKISLYAKPTEKSEVLDQINIRQSLIPIYRQDDWIKVGNPKDGKVGWINIKQYRKMLKELMYPSIKSITITTYDDPDKEGKTEIVAYRNGKKLDEKEAEKLLKQFHKRQSHMEKHLERHFMHMQERMDKVFDLMFNPMWSTWGLEVFNIDD